MSKLPIMLSQRLLFCDVTATVSSLDENGTTQESRQQFRLSTEDGWRAMCEDIANVLVHGDAVLITIVED